MTESVVVNEFKSRLEDLMPAEELNFPPTPAFGPYRKYLDHAISHPAKANTHLLEFLIKKYTKPEEVVLDPMAGSGSTCVIAALLGRNAVCVDIEPKFYEWMEKSRENVEKTKTMTPKGWIKNILGDARKLSSLLEEADIIITSPPYAEANRGGGIAVKGYEGKYGKDEKLHLRHDRPLSDNPDNISNMPLGNVDAIITSPPYGDTNLSGGDPNKRVERLTRAGYDPKDYVSGRARNAVLKHYSEIVNPNNIGNLESSDEEYEALARGLMKDGKPTYLSEMLKVYGEMFKVLKSGGVAVVIVKPFIRNKKVVDLPYYTWLLMERVGFKLEKLYKLRLKQMSFWRILYYKKNPDVPLIAHEYVLVCRKP